MTSFGRQMSGPTSSYGDNVTEDLKGKGNDMRVCLFCDEDVGSWNMQLYMLL